MNSAELNAKIAAICDDYGLYESFGRKCIPYIGWYWRNVNFDSKTHMFGRFPDEEGFDTAPSKNGFMENNKWDYGYVKANEEQWAEIKRLLVEAVTNTTTETLKAVDDAIQALDDFISDDDYYDEWVRQ